MVTKGRLVFDDAFSSRADAAVYLAVLGLVPVGICIAVLGMPTLGSPLLLGAIAALAALALRCGRGVEDRTGCSRWSGLAGAQVMWFASSWVYK